MKVEFTTQEDSGDVVGNVHLSREEIVGISENEIYKSIADIIAQRVADECGDNIIASLDLEKIKAKTNEAVTIKALKLLVKE